MCVTFRCVSVQVLMIISIVYVCACVCVCACLHVSVCVRVCVSLSVCLWCKYIFTSRKSMRGNMRVLLRTHLHIRCKTRNSFQNTEKEDGSHEEEKKEEEEEQERGKG